MKKYVGSALILGLIAFYSSAHAQFIPGGAASVGSANVVPDVPFWYDSVANRVKIGPIVPLLSQQPDNGNWEPWVSVIGEKVFVVEVNKFADDGTASVQRYVVAFQPAAPGTWANGKLGECFYDDYGKPYTNGISSRNDGNPGRVYGDRRDGAVNFVTGGEADPQDYPGFFQTAGRFDTATVLYGNAASIAQRCDLIQAFSLDLTTLVQTPLCKAFDGNSLGHPEFLALASGNQQRGRFGGGLAALDNGNFAAVMNDRSDQDVFFPGNAPGDSTIACIFTPTGGVVKASWLVRPVAAWTDPTGFKGGFCIRSGGLLYFYQNDGTLIAGDVDHNALSGVALDTGRGDGTKIAGDIRAPWVYYASAGWLTVWNGTNGAFITSYKVNDDLDASSTVDRTDVACDSLGNVCVAWNGKPVPAATAVGTNLDQSFVNDQVMARVLKFNGTTVTPLTHTFFPFINSDTAAHTNLMQGFKTTNPNLDMTTKYICIAGKGQINSTNNAEAAWDSQAQTTVYTVINNPGYVPVAPQMTAARSGNNIIISWDASVGDCTLQSTPTVKPTAWANVTPQPASVLVGNTYQKTVAIGSANTFFRLAQ